MSGAEIIGLAASVISIAELGGKLSVKIFTFTRKVKNANKTIDALSQEIAVTGAVLQQLGETLSNDQSVKVCSQEAIDTAKKLVSDTERVFKSLEKLLDVDEKSGSIFRKAVNLRRLRFPFLESEIEEVQANLERLKSSLLVILNVLIFAEQLRNRETLPILEDQRELIRTLAAEKDANEQRYERLLKAIADRPKIAVDDPGKSATTSSSSFDATSTNSTTLTLVNTGDNASQHSSTSIQPTFRRVIDLPLIDLPRGLKRYHETIHNHTQLVQNLLTEIDCLEYKLDHSVRGRLQNGVLDIHWKEWDIHRYQFGIEPLEKMFASSSEVARYWGVKSFDEQQRERLRQRDQISPGTDERFARLQAIEELKRREEERSTGAAKSKGDAREEALRKERLALEYESKMRKGQQAEEDTVAKAGTRAKFDQFLAVEREKAAMAAARQKAESARISAEGKDGAAAEELERNLIIAEERLRLERQNREAEAIIRGSHDRYRYRSRSRSRRSKSSSRTDTFVDTKPPEEWFPENDGSESTNTDINEDMPSKTPTARQQSTDIHFRPRATPESDPSRSRYASMRPEPVQPSFRPPPPRVPRIPSTSSSHPDLRITGRKPATERANGLGSARYTEKPSTKYNSIDLTGYPTEYGSRRSPLPRSPVPEQQSPADNFSPGQSSTPKPFLEDGTSFNVFGDATTYTHLDPATRDENERSVHRRREGYTSKSTEGEANISPVNISTPYTTVPVPRRKLQKSIEDESDPSDDFNDLIMRYTNINSTELEDVFSREEPVVLLPRRSRRSRRRHPVDASTSDEDEDAGYVEVEYEDSAHDE